MTFASTRCIGRKGLTTAGFFLAAMGATIGANAKASAGQVNPSMLAGLQWRNIGPHHGGRVSAVGAPIGKGQTAIFYAGLPVGGLMKTTDAGETWFPIFDHFRNVDGVGAVAVAPSNPDIVYVGTGDSIAGDNGDGMYKSTDAGKTWTHIGLEDTVKINRILISPTNPDVVLVSTQGNSVHRGRGVFRTTDGGKTWTNVLNPAGYNGTLALARAYDVPNVIFAATGGKRPFPFGPPPKASKSKAKTGAKAKPESTAGAKPAAATSAASKFAAKPATATSAASKSAAKPGAKQKSKAKPKPKATPAELFKSTDGGVTWTQVTTIPKITERMGVAVAMHTNAQRIYIIGGGVKGGSGLFRSDNGGKTWKHMDPHDGRISNGQGGYNCGVYVNPDNPDVVYTISTAMYRSTDGGKTFHAYKGAPGGEDPHVMWIDPTNGNRQIVGVDQGAGVTLNNGATWSSYYSIEAGQFYHIVTTDQYPFWVFGSQQDTGGAGTRNRSDMGEINHDWRAIPSSESGRLAASPLDPEIIYADGYGPGGGGSGLVKLNLHTGDWENVAPNFGANAKKYHQSHAYAKHFDPFDPHALYVAYQCLMVTTDGAKSWKIASPDLTTKKGQKQIACGAKEPKPAHSKSKPHNPFGPRGNVIVDFSISTAKNGVMWTVSNNGQIYNTFDGGKHWTNVSNLPGIDNKTYAKNLHYINIQASHQNPEEAYLTAQLGRVSNLSSIPVLSTKHSSSGKKQDKSKAKASVLPDVTGANIPLIWRTTDGGKTWTKIVNGLPIDQRTGSYVNVIREDPKQAGLLFVGTESGVYVSFNDGNSWQSLQNNMPTTSIRDLKIHTFDHENDLVAATFGRGIWVLDDITPLQQITTSAEKIAAAPAYLFAPADAIRSRENVNWDQPTEPWEHHSPNPPYGAYLYYHLSRKPSGPISISIYNAAGSLVDTIPSTLPPPIKGNHFPRYWLASPQSRALTTHLGTNRFVWNLRYAPPPAFRPDLENQMNSVEDETTPGPKGPQVIPGVYTVKLTVDGRTYSRKLTVVNDPRIGQSPQVMAALEAQNQLNLLAYHAMQTTHSANGQVEAVAKQVDAIVSDRKAPANVLSQAKAVQKKLKTFGGKPPKNEGFFFFFSHRPKPGAMKTFIDLNNSFNSLVSMVQVGLDMYPTPAQVGTWNKDCKEYNRTIDAWNSMRTKDLAAFNQLLKTADQKPVTVSAALQAQSSCGLTSHYPAIGKQ
ncbi:MAG TPA: hypothetical protein VF292_15480 [Rhodanobacteraceae bacterium]